MALRASKAAYLHQTGIDFNSRRISYSAAISSLGFESSALHKAL